MNTLELAQELIKIESVTPEDAGCQKLIGKRLEKLGFETEILIYEDVTNLWATLGTGEPFLVFAGHTDVVPPGPMREWQHHPFEANVVDGKLYGRGTVDMKGSIAAFITALERTLKDKTITGTIGILLTSDEEGPAVNGTVKVLDELEKRNIKFNHCLIGEPTTSKDIGDTIKIGRRGSLGATLKIKGKQGHIAYPHLAENSIHLALPILQKIIDIKLDSGNEYFPPTTLQVSNVNAGTGATNVIPGEIEIEFNIRFSTETSFDILQNEIMHMLKVSEKECEILWHLNGEPFLSSAGKLVKATQDAIRKITDLETELSTSGGTSDGRFIARTGAEIVELGLCNATAHKIDEFVEIEDLDKLSNIYEETLINLFSLQMI